MTIGSISAAGLSQYVLASGTSTQVEQALQVLQDSLASGDLTVANLAFQTVQKLNENSATAIGDGLSSSSPSQLSTDLAALGSALSSGDLSAAQSAFAALHGALNKAPSPSQINEINAAAFQSVQLVHELLNSLNPSTSSSSASNGTTSVLEAVYGSKRSLNVLA